MNSGYKVNMKYNKPASVELKNDKQRNKCKNKSKRKRLNSICCSEF